MEASTFLDVRPEVAAALSEKRPVVGIGSAPIAYNLPWPINLETAQEAEAAVRRHGAVPAFVGVWRGRPTIGLEREEREEFARGKIVFKASRRDLAAAIVQGRTAATTLSANLCLVQQTGIRLLVTGGVGSLGAAYEGGVDLPDDLVALARSPVAVVSAGSKGILGLSRTVEILDSLGVPVVGYGTDSLSAFYVRATSQPVSARVNSPGEAVGLLNAHWGLGGKGVLFAQPVPAKVALDPDTEVDYLLEIEREAIKVRSRDLTPFLTSRLAKMTGGKSLQAYKQILVANADLAARIAVELR